MATNVAILYHDAVQPETFGITVPAGTSGSDMSTVTTGVFLVTRADGTTTTWTCILSNQSVSSVDLIYTRVAQDTYTSGVRVTGAYQAYGVLTLPNGTLRTLPFGLLVLPPFSVQQ